MTGLKERGSPKTLADLIESLGGIGPDRILTRPAPGTATEADAESRECELIDGTLVRKEMGWRESLLAGFLLRVIGQFADEHNLGLVVGADGFYELFPGTVRGPDVSFVAFRTLPGGKQPTAAFPQFAPDLVVEVLSPGNTNAEMRRKRADYFAAGVKLVWEIDPARSSATIFGANDAGTALDIGGVLDGGSVLPGFALPLASVFAELDRTGPGAPESPVAP